MLKSLIFSNVLLAIVLLLMESEAQTTDTNKLTTIDTNNVTIGTQPCSKCFRMQSKCWHKCKNEGVGVKDKNGNCLWKCPGKESEECKACKICQTSKECKACLACLGPNWKDPVPKKCSSSSDCRKCADDC